MYADYALCLYVEFIIYVTRLSFGSSGTCMWAVDLSTHGTDYVSNHQKLSTLDEDNIHQVLHILY